MSTEALQQALADLQALPADDQDLVLNFLHSVKERRGSRIQQARFSTSNPALVFDGNLLVFAGTIDAPDLDWVQRAREDLRSF